MNSGHGFLSFDSEEIIKDIEKQYPGIWSFALETNGFVDKFQYELKIHLDSLPELLSVSFFTRVISNYQAMLLLASKGMVPQCNVMLRILIEALFSLVAISEEPEYTQVIIGHEEHQRKSILNKLKRYKEGENKEDLEIEINNDVIKENRGIRLTPAGTRYSGSGSHLGCLFPLQGQ